MKARRTLYRGDGGRKTWGEMTYNLRETKCYFKKQSSMKVESEVNACV